MNYFQPYPLETDNTVTSAWESQVKQAAQTPWLANAIAECASDLFPRFAACYSQLGSLPRSARRALQHQLARSGELTTVFQAQRKIGRELQRKLAYSLAGAALLLALAPGLAAAATIKVTTTIPDINDGDGKCSLIEAIVNANNDQRTFRDCSAGHEADTIVLPKNSVHTLTSTYDYAYGPTGLPKITSPVTIQGNGAKIVRQQASDGSAVVPEFRLLAVTGSGDLRLRNVTLMGGLLSDQRGGCIHNTGNVTIKKSTISGNATAVSGGAIYNAGYLTIENSTLSGNTIFSNDEFPVGGGGGVSNMGYATIENSTISRNTGSAVANYGTLALRNSTVSENIAGAFSASGNYVAGFGGGVFNFGGYLTIDNSILSGNNAMRDGGGVDNTDGTAAIRNSTISGNTVSNDLYWADGGGLYNSGTMNIINSTISGNTVRSGSYPTSGGGIYNTGYLSIENSTVADNTVSSNSSTAYGGGIYNSSGTATLTNSTISGNRATSGSSSAIGGGVYNSMGTARILNSTISGNLAISDSYFSRGGGIFNGGSYSNGVLYAGTVAIENSTITGNTASSGSSVSQGGGVYSSYTGSTFALSRSLLSGNNASIGPEAYNAGAMYSDDFNLFGNAGNAGVTGFTPGLSDIVPAPAITASKILGPLKKNGGPTKTHALVKGTPAINVIPFTDPGCSGTDQRGVARPRGHGCDIGAFEK